MLPGAMADIEAQCIPDFEVHLGPTKGHGEAVGVNKASVGAF